MTEREKVIKGLECSVSLDIADCSRKVCPYWEYCDGGCAPDAMLIDALELLKAQEPRVMEIQELYDAIGMQGYIETRKQVRPCFIVYHHRYSDWCFATDEPEETKHTIGIMDQSHLNKRWQGRLYKKTWRVWTARPTDEQREAVSWDD